MKLRAPLVCGALVLTSMLPACNRELRQRREELRRLAAETRTLADSLDAARRKGLAAAASGAVVERPDLGECPVPAQLPIGERDPAVVKRMAPLIRLPMVPLYMLGVDVVSARELANTPGPRRRFVESDLNRVEEVLTNDALLEGKDGNELLERLRRESQRAWWTPDLTLATVLYVPPARQGDGTHFSGGLVSGRAYLWSYEEGAVLCTSVSAAASSEKVQVTGVRVGSSPATLLDLGEVQRDVKFNAVERALPGLRRAGPPPAP